MKIQTPPTTDEISFITNHRSSSDNDSRGQQSIYMYVQQFQATDPLEALVFQCQPLKDQIECMFMKNHVLIACRCLEYNLTLPLLHHRNALHCCCAYQPMYLHHFDSSLLLRLPWLCRLITALKSLSLNIQLSHFDFIIWMSLASHVGTLCTQIATLPQQGGSQRSVLSPLSQLLVCFNTCQPSSMEH